MAKQANYLLEEVFKIVDSGEPDRIWFSARSRSIDAVIKAYMNTQCPKTIEGAQNFILSGIKTLTPNDFVESVYQWDCIADVYGIIYDERSWYVKFRIDENNDLEQISFHPPTKEMKTISENLIPRGKFL